MDSLDHIHSITLHGRSYRLPQRPTVVVCIDGFDPDYLEAGIEDGILPNMSSWVASGFHVTANSAMPSVTNTNNLSIITGAPSNVHGIFGNFYLDKTTGQEHMVLDNSTLRGSTILKRMSHAGVRVAAITAKDKLRKMIDHGLSPANGDISFSSQYAKHCTHAENGISDVEEWIGRPTPEQYSADLSLFVLDAGLKLLQEGRAELFYLTLSDFIQHKFAPKSPEANDFLHNIDTILGEFAKLGAVVAVTGDHGMSDKCDPNGNPNVLYLEDELNLRWPECGARVICPIADYSPKHHGALGGFVRVYLKQSSDATVQAMLEHCWKLPEVEVAVTGKEACELWDMPLDREGDFVVVTRKNAVAGSRRDEHDLGNLTGYRLRSHGGLSEQAVPLIRSTPIQGWADLERKAWRNFDVFDLALNY